MIQHSTVRRLPVPRHSVCLWLLALASILASVFPLAAEEAPAAQEESEETFSETVDVEVVNVEVMVTDRSGQPVTDLSREDFEIFEDGEKMELTNFYASQTSLPEQGQTASQIPEESILPPGATRELHLAIFVDNLSIRPENRKLLFEELRRNLHELENSRARLALATLGSKLEIVEPFTDDRERIFAALAKIEKRTSYEALFDSERRMFMSRLQQATVKEYTPRTVFGSNPLNGQPTSMTVERDPDFDTAVRVAMDLAITTRTLAERRYQNVRASARMLAAFSDTLGGLSGRKAILYLSDGLPLRPADTLIEAWLGKYDSWASLNEDDIRQNSPYPEAAAEFQRLTSSLGSSQFDLQQELNQLASQASENRVVFYPISASGRNTGFVSAAIGGGGLGAGTGTGSMNRRAQTTENFSRDASLLRLAEDTGGEALIRSSNLGVLLDRLRRDFETFYSLGYSPPGGEGDGRFHRLQVKVNRPGLSVRHVKGYSQRNWRQRLGGMTVASALYSVDTNPLGVKIDPGEATPEGKKFRVPIMVKIPIEKLRLVHQDEHFNAQLTVLIQVSDEDDGALSEPRRFDLPVKIPDGRVLEAMAQVAAYPLELVMERGPKRVAVAVRDHLAQTEATVNLSMMVGQERRENS